MSQRTDSAKRGFTLIELVIVVVMLSFLTVVVTMAFVSGLRIWSSTKDRAEMRQDGAMAMDMMLRELMQASRITTAAADEITFEADIDDNGSDETLTYSVTDNEPIRTVGTQDRVLCRDVTALTFAYRDNGDDPMSIPSDVASQAKRDTIRIITLTVTAEKNDETITLSTSAYARNQPTS